MGAYKDKNGKWYISVRYKNWLGEGCRKTKRGFTTKRDALEWEREFLAKNTGSLDMTFGSFYLHHEMRRGCSASGVKRIRIHGIRHSHISLLIDMGFSAVAIADRVGHESIDITYRYAHVFPSTQMEIVSKLNNVMICSDADT